MVIILNSSVCILVFLSVYPPVLVAWRSYEDAVLDLQAHIATESRF